MQTVKTSINLDEATAEALERLAAHEERNRSDVMRRLIRAADSKRSLDVDDDDEDEDEKADKK